MIMKCVEFNTKDKQMDCVKSLENMGRRVLPMVFFIDGRQIGKFYVYYE